MGAARPAPQSLPLSNYYWALPERLLAGEHPAGATAEATQARLQSLLASGINCFIDLTQEHEQGSYERSLPASVQYLRRPLPDHGTPERPEAMAEILDCLRAALAQGQRVYLHCRAGIGRTGMTIGCLLAETGYAGEAALEELNRLWQQSQRARQWPSIPETDAQSAYVRSWSRVVEGPDPLLEPQALAAARGLRERYLGALLGLATGDALGISTQFRRPGRFAPLGDLLGGGPFDLPRGAWSDDTAMALCLAESLLEKGGFDARDQGARYRRWQKEGHLSATGQCVGITAATARALARAQWRRQAYSGSHDPESLDPESLSRVPAIVLFYFADREAALAHAAEAARATCQAPLVLEACRALAAALHAAVAGAGKDEILGAAQALIGSTDRPAALGQEGSAPGTLATALEVFAGADNFRDAVLAAANLGGAADVTAGAVGALAGAHYGAGAIPTMWRNSLMKLQLLEGFADRLLAHTLLEFGGGA
jgi:ADP-ribosylglycohydrolase/protein-tyrosine phosphatase